MLLQAASNIDDVEVVCDEEFFEVDDVPHCSEAVTRETGHKKRHIKKLKKDQEKCLESMETNELREQHCEEQCWEHRGVMDEHGTSIDKANDDSDDSGSDSNGKDCKAEDEAVGPPVASSRAVEEEAAGGLD